MASTTNSYGFSQPQIQNLPMPNQPGGSQGGVPSGGPPPQWQQQLPGGNFDTPAYLAQLYNNFSSQGGGDWQADDWRGATKSELENLAFPAMQMGLNYQQAAFDRELGGFNAQQQAYMNQANMQAMNRQQNREDSALQQGAAQWGQEFSEAQRQAGMQDELMRWQTQQTSDVAREQLAAQMGLSREQMQSQEGQAALDRAMQQQMQQAGFGQQQWQTGQELGFSREQGAAQRALERELQGGQLGFSREQLTAQMGSAAADRAQQLAMQQAGFGQQQWQTGQEMGLQREQMSQQASQFGRQQSLAEQQSAQRYGEGGLESQKLGLAEREGIAGRTSQERMLSQQLGSTSELERESRQLERERMASQEKQTRWGQFGRAQAPNSTWARNWG